MTLLLQQLVNGVSLGFAYALIAVGFSLVFGTIKILNFAHAELVMIAGFAAWVAGTQFGGSFPVILLAAILAGAVLAVVLERGLIRPVAGKSFVAPFITTLGASLILVAVAKQVWGTNPRRFPTGFPTRQFELVGVRISSVQIVIAITALCSMAALAWFVNRTRWGLMIRATAQNPEVAEATGVNTSMLSMITMAVSGVLAGVGGVLLGVAFGVVSPFVGALYGLKGLVAMIIGGIGSLRGAVVAGVLIGVGEVLTVAYVSSTWRDAIAFGLLIAVLLWRPAGLFGRRGERYVPASL